MSLPEIILLALALAVDAFTVGMAVGLNHRGPRQVFRLSFHFGLFQALFPLVGALAGIGLRSSIEAVDHWIAFGLLAFVGGRMILAWFRPDERTPDRDLTRGMSLMILSTAVSIDALAVGFTLGVTDEHLLVPILVIGIVAAAATVVGMSLSGRLGPALGRHLELVAGLVLVGIGAKILLDHLR